MTKQLKGRIFWVLDDFSYTGEIIPKKDATSHTAARLENVIIDEHMIKFYVCPYKSSDGDEYSYNVNLLVNDTGTRFNGYYSFEKEPSWRGEVFCELFSNKGKYLLQGRWIEEDCIYTFWAIIDKE
jgi:hypothetical protein